MTVKAEATRMIADLPEESTWESILYRVCLCASLERAEAEIEAGHGIPHEQVKREMAEWLESLGARQLEPISKPT